MNRKERRAGVKQKASGDAAALFAMAVKHHRSGQLQDAESCYRKVLAAHPEHFSSLQNLGIIGLQRRQPQMAIEMIGRALALNDGIPDCHYNMAFALQSVGRLNDAVAPYRRAIELRPDYIEAHTNLGNVLNSLGRHNEAVASYQRVIALGPAADAHYNLANALSSLGRMDEAVTHYRGALALEPGLAGAHNNLANTLVAQGRPDEALIHFERALGLNPELVEANVNLGNTFLQMGRLDAAAAQFERALTINPQYADAHANLGNVHLEQGRLDDAARCYRRAIELEPGLAGAHNNLGIVLAARGDYEEAGRRFQLALAGKPDFIDAYNNLARVFLSLGQIDNALGALRRALSVAETADTKSLFVQCAKSLSAPPDFEDFRSLLLRAITEPWGRTNDLTPIAGRAVKQDAAIGAWIARVQAGPLPLPAQELPGLVAALAGNRLMRCLLQSAAIGDIELERLLTAVRAALLERAGADASTVAEEDLSAFSSALARQCFLNEYVFTHTEGELAQAERLREEVSAALACDGPIPELRLAVVASYFPLGSLPGAPRLLERTWSGAMIGLQDQQIREPAAERQLAASIPELTRVADEVSRRVQSQYEENPYPRWAAAEPPDRPLPFDRYLRRRLPASRFENLDKPQIDILVAGCGTGQHAIETAQRFAGANVLAVDLSLASLAFAERKTRALGRTNIAYGLADILELGSLGRSFDLIEASGVLHHMRDPLAGWRALLSLLRPGGFMTLGVYSEIARAEIAEARAFIAEQGYRPTPQDIRRCRQDLVSLRAGKRFQSITASIDFFSMSGCRDLLFHVQEHRFTIPQLAGFLADNDLAFIGFDVDHFTSQQYRSRFPHDQAMADLACWDLLERDQPRIFSGMYQFWVQKRT